MPPMLAHPLSLVTSPSPPDPAASFSWAAAAAASAAGLPAPHAAPSHDDLMKSCEFCPSRFELETELADHVSRFHIGVKKFFCFVCHKRFKRKQSLENHINMIHSG